MDWTKEAVEARKNYIGGSDAAAILGISRYKTPLQVWAIKTGQVVPPNIDDVVAVRLGNKLEQAVAEFFEEDTKKKVDFVTPAWCEARNLKYITYPDDDKRVTIFHPLYSFIGANIDRIVIDEEAGLECKTAGERKTSEWKEEEIPAEYIIQCYHYMAVTGLKKWYIAVLLGNREFKWKEITCEQKVLDDMIAKEVYFWNTFILPKVMPMQITAQDSSILYTLFPQVAQESIIELGDEAQKICESLDSMKADHRVLDKEIEEQENILKAMLKTYETGTTQVYKITWKNQEEKRIDSERLKREEPGLYEKFCKPSGKRVLRIAVKK